MKRTSILLGTCIVLTLAVGCGGGGTPGTTAGGPTITSIEPASGGMVGGTNITIRGTGLSNPQPGSYQILIGGQPATGISVVGTTEVQCTTPPGPVGPADVTVITILGEGVVEDGYTYHPPPTVTAITPDAGTRDGGTLVTVTGTGFANNDPGETTCRIDLKYLTDVVVIDDTTLTGVTPPSWLEIAKDVTVENNNGTGTLVRGWTYFGPIPQIYSIDPPEGLMSGGTAVTITGDFFTIAGGEISVTFGNAEAALVTRVDDQTVTCFTPASPVYGFVDVTVGNSNGDSTLSNGFFYIAPPTPQSVTPNSGPIDGGTAVTITGFGFTSGPVNLVRFGGELATSVVAVDDSTITCVTPPGSILGLVDLTVTNDAGSGLLSNAFTYLPPSFWWENTLGTAFSSTGDDPYQLIPLSYGFPFYDQSWDGVYGMANGHLDFGSSSNYSYSVATNLFSIPHISHMGMDCYTNTSNNIWYTQHISGRTIITYNGVPEYYNYGANYVQIHLHQSGIFCILYKDITFKHASGYSAYSRVAINPGGGTSQTVDWSAGVTGAGSGVAPNEIFSTQADLDNAHLIFTRTAGGGYDAAFVNGIPTDPNP